jgi:formylglycine-generating enzyme required for sulfatase activity
MRTLSAKAKIKGHQMKTMLRFLFVVLALFVGIHQATAQVSSLGIAPAGNQTVLFWPTAATNYTLQSTTNLASPNWGIVTNGIPLMAVSVTNTSPAMFFRLYNTNTPPGMAYIPAGSFTMGDTLDNEGDAIPTNVTVSDFYMDVDLVTSNQWRSVYNWAVTNGYGFVNAGAGRATNQPVQTVDWYDAVKWCNARSQMEGLTPVYYTDAGMTQIYTNGEVAITNVNWSANGFRLPTEAEWEKAARGGLSGQRFPWGDTISESQANYLGSVGGYDLGPSGYNTNFDTGAQPYTSPVGYFAPNGYGLYDMAGNIFEWCWDWYGTPYGQPTTNNPTGPGTGTYRVIRGGYWNGPAAHARCAYRTDLNNPFNANDAIGFRCVRGY